MSLDDRIYGVAHAALVVSGVEGALGVAPGEVVEELADRLGEVGWSGPDLALADEDVDVLHADEDVGLALVVEDLAAGQAFEDGVQADEQDEPDLFLM